MTKFWASDENVCRRKFSPTNIFTDEVFFLRYVVFIAVNIMLIYGIVSRDVSTAVLQELSMRIVVLYISIIYLLFVYFLISVFTSVQFWCVISQNHSQIAPP